MKKTLSFLFLIVFVSQSSISQTTYPLASDINSPEAIVKAAYEAIKRAPGEKYNWERFNSLFIDKAILTPNSEQTGGQFRVISPKEFIQWIDQASTIGGSNDKGFSEEEISSKIEIYGDIAHVFSTYQKRFWNESQILGRGINTFQLIYRNNRWWITSIAWDEETGAGPIPGRYLPKSN